MSWKRALIAGLLVLPLLWLFGLGFGRNPHAVPSVLEGKPAPAFALVSLDGTPMRSEELRGRPVVVNFWASWCQPCMVEHADLQAAAREYGARVHFVGIIYQDTAEAAREYLNARGSIFTQLLDPTTKVAIDFGVAGVPESFFIDAKGIVRRKVVGALSAPQLRYEIEGLLQGPSS